MRILNGIQWRFYADTLACFERGFEIQKFSGDDKSMDMGQIRKDSLVTKVRLFGKLWGDQQLQDVVCKAITDDDVAALVDIIDTLATKANEQKELIANQTKLIAALQDTVEEIGAILAEQKQNRATDLIVPPAKKSSLKTEEMYSLYQQYNSFNKVGELLGCAGRTVSRRLRAEGYID